MKLTYLETGGFAPVVRGCEFDLDALAPDEAAQLRQLIDHSGIQSADDIRLPGACDALTVTITLETPAGLHRVRIDLPALPDQIAPLVSFLRQRSKDLLSEN